ncbi:MAG: TetR/AcrR family transcriptional regulator [Actinomycetota bacterium]|nr:TetR/AcrR family transcriptional regulator [Actinomycetota bacterium]
MSESTLEETLPPPRKAYRHGDLRNALLREATALAREGGPDAVILREVTRRAGVAPNAAYRHFANRRELLFAVAAAAQSEMAKAMEAELARIPDGLDTGGDGRARLRAVGTGYLRFARQEPGLFRTAFTVHDDLSNATIRESGGSSGLTPFQLLAEAIEKMASAGLIPARRRDGAEFLAWSAVHGLSTLLIDGPLQVFGPELAENVGERLIDMVERGL